MLLASLALAQDTSTDEWRHVYERGTATARAGMYVGIVGEGLSLTGTLLAIGAGTGAALQGDEDITDNPAVIVGLGMATVGELATRVGAPMMAGGSLRARRGLADGGIEASPVAGLLAWGLWGGSLALGATSTVLSYTDPVDTSDLTTASLGRTLLGLADTACLAGSYAAGGVQMGVNRGAYRRLSLHVTPMPMRGGAGSAIAFRF